MNLAAGKLNRRIRIERRVGGQDATGQPIDAWSLVGEPWVGIANETGLGAIRSVTEANVSTSIARYSFLMRFGTAKALGIDAGMRAVYDGLVFDIKGLTRDLEHREKVFLICEQGGNDG